jgi:ADP-heptose:LPS heptosyltransferase
LIITIDSMPAHLAGALGVPTWVLLHSDCDWRWMRNRTDSPWYPSMRLFRQNHPGEWPPVIARVKQELKRLASSQIKPLSAAA